MCRFNSLADQKFESIDNEYLDISFKYIDWECEHFFLEGLKNQNYQELFAALNRLKFTTNKSFREQTAYDLTPKAIFKTETGLYKEFNQNTVELLSNALKNEEDPKTRAREYLRQAFEIRITGKNHGRIHGFLMNHTFHIVWFDPAHNLYHGKRKPQSMKEYATVKRCFSPDEFEKLQKENSELYDLLDQATVSEKE